MTKLNVLCVEVVQNFVTYFRKVITKKILPLIYILAIFVCLKKISLGEKNLVDIILLKHGNVSKDELEWVLGALFLAAL